MDADDERNPRITVDIKDVMASLSELGVPDDIQRGCYELLQRRNDAKFKSLKVDTRGDGMAAGRPDRAGIHTGATLPTTMIRTATGQPPSHMSSLESFDDLDVLRRRDSGSSDVALRQSTGQMKYTQSLLEPSDTKQIRPQAARPSSRADSSGHARDADHETVSLRCPRSMVGRVIGKSGDTIKALQQYTNTSIQIDQSDEPTRVTISGSGHSVRMAEVMVSDIINGRFKGFAMLRHIAPQSPAGSARGSIDVENDGSVAGLIAGASGACQQGWQPTYIQGYGFVPPPLSAGSGSAVYNKTSFGDMPGGRDKSIESARRASYDCSIQRNTGVTPPTGHTPQGSAPKPLSSIANSSQTQHRSSDMSLNHEAILSKLMQISLQQLDAYRCHTQQREMMIQQQQALRAQTNQEDIYTLGQLRGMQLRGMNLHSMQQHDMQQHGGGGYVAEARDSFAASSGVSGPRPAPSETLPLDSIHSDTLEAERQNLYNFRGIFEPNPPNQNQNPHSE